MTPHFTTVTDAAAHRAASSAEPEVSRRWWERPVSTDWLFRGEDEVGRRGWFLRFEVTGLYPRRIGPFATRAAALDCLNHLVCEIQLEPLLELQNSVEDGQQYVIEGVPRLKGR